MIGSPEYRKHLDRLSRERIVKVRSAQATLECIEHRISAFHREAELSDLLGDLDPDSPSEWLSKHLTAALGRELSILRDQIEELK